MQKLLETNPFPGSFVATVNFLMREQNLHCEKNVIALKKDQETLQGKGMLGLLMH